MGSDKKKDVAGDEAARLKKEKKEKKRSEKDGVSKSSKKDKKDKKSKERLASALDEHLQASAAGSAVKAPAVVDDAESDEEMDEAKAIVAKGELPKGALVSFALPLADDKVQKKVLKAIKKATKKHALLRGVKEVNKALRKAPTKTATTTEVPGVVIIAGDISPAEVIMHLPVYCEERNVPYLFVPSRAELGAAAKTKRPTSVVMLLAQGRKREADKKKKDAIEEDGEEDDYPKAYKELVSTAQKEFAKQLRGLL
ncbi:hypothetical protein MCOR25_004666 [Pyricularia grisea]|uniref:Ribosomal protein eL8/eL30/eS12/Gadd45 domain-containing protein n=1 Tax=Pyricularia grisea TaxID=148305 RepID=A0A6P8BFX4_PYRGI|nr:uncharacterized protein PgNI_01886 [Pyricularia grisea]KAI6368369.1 hypothetical protein MCOR25_004666 [Pyricularia grisea]TLD15746.1 hypothetical protein PgNI_01886 [Pyricularia grisea]